MNLSSSTFWGYKRENGRIGVRNHVIILPVDDLSNAAAEAVANNIKGTLALPHPYGRLQFGYEKRAGGVSLLGSQGGWPQMATKYEIDTVSYVNTLLHTFNPTTFAEFTVGVNWAHQYTSPFDQSALDANDRRKVLPGLPQFFPQANPSFLLPQASFPEPFERVFATPHQVDIASIAAAHGIPYARLESLSDLSKVVAKEGALHNVRANVICPGFVRTPLVDKQIPEQARDLGIS